MGGVRLFGGVRRVNDLLALCNFVFANKATAAYRAELTAHNSFVAAARRNQEARLTSATRSVYLPVEVTLVLVRCFLHFS